MKHLLFLLAATVSAQTIRSISATAGQAVVYYSAPSSGSSCVFEVSTSPTYSPVVDALNQTLFPSAATDTTASVFRAFVIGERRAAPSGNTFYSLSLRSQTAYYLRLICDGLTGSAATASFVTKDSTVMAPDPLPFDTSAYGNFAVPDFDWSDRSKCVVDPQTALPVCRIGDPKDFASNTGPHLFTSFAGASGWTSASNILSGSTGSLAVAGNTNPVYLPVDPSNAITNGGFNLTATQGHPLTDVGVRIFGSGSDATASNRQISVCLSIDNATCYTNAIIVTLPQTTAADMGVTPSTYPAALFAGWGKAVPREYHGSKGYVTASAGTVTLTKDGAGTAINSNTNSAASRFQHEWAAGTLFNITGSSGTCGSSNCTIASVTNQTTLVLNENLTIAENTYKNLPLTVRIVKTNATGTVSVSASYRLAKSFVLHLSANNGCSTSTTTFSVDRSGSAASPEQFFMCIFDWHAQSGGRLYAISKTRPEEVRFLSAIKQPASISGHISADLPSSPVETPMVSYPTFDLADPTYFVTAVRSGGGSTAIFQIRYTGDGRDNAAAQWASSADSTPATGDANLTWLNLTKSADSRDLRTLILAGTTYDESRWGNLSGLAFAGLTETHSLWYSPPIGGQDTPCWVFAFSNATGNLAFGYHTLNGIAAGARGSGCHAVQTAAGKMMIAASNLGFGDSRMLGGPFVTTPTHVYRSGAWSTNTAIPDIGDLVSNAYDRTCPSDLAQIWKDQGAVGNECIQIRIPNEPCSSVAGASEKAWLPCPSDANKSWIGSALAEGDTLFDAAPGVDSETITVVRRTGNDFVFLRDSGLGYACQSQNLRGRDCAAVPAQNVHLNGASWRIVPRAGNVLAEPSTGAIVFEDPNSTRGHFSYEALSGGTHNYAGVGTPGYVSRYNAPATSFGQRYSYVFAEWPSFAGQSSNYSGSSQSYIAVGGSASTTADRRFASDWRHPNGGLGLAVEAYGQVIGPTMTFTLQGGTTGVYLVGGATSGFDPKRSPLWVWMGRYIFRDASTSTTGNIITDATPWTFCYAVRVNECRTGSTIGQLYVAAPGLQTGLTQCHASQISYRSLCVFPATASFGRLMDVRIDRDDRQGLNQRAIGMALTRPGSQYVYSKAKPFSNGRAIIATSWNVQGVYSLPVIIPIGTRSETSANRTTYQPFLVGAPTNSIVEFGYNSSFHCMTRSEVCKVAASSITEATPFTWSGDSLTASSGSAIAVPAIAGRVLYYRVVTAGTPGPVQVVAP